MNFITIGIFLEIIRILYGHFELAEKSQDARYDTFCVSNRRPLGFARGDKKKRGDNVPVLRVIAIAIVSRR